MSRQQRYQDRIASLEAEHKKFVQEEPLSFTLGLFQRLQVESNQVWQVFRDGVFYKQLKPGPHFLWRLWHKWRVQRVDLRIVRLPIEAEGRVKGPQVNDGSSIMQRVDLACDVVALFQLSCKIADIEKYLQFEEPLTVFFASFYDMVYEIIGKLPYDQYGEWATELRNIVKRRLQGGDKDPLYLIGLKIEEVYVTSITPNDEQDANNFEIFKLGEQAKKELLKAQSNRSVDREVYASYREKGEIINIAPSILALQNSPIGEQLIGSDAELRRLMVAAGLNPSINIQPIPDPQNPLSQMSTSSMGYLQPPQRPQLPLGNSQQLPLNPGRSPFEPAYPTGPFSPESPTIPANSPSGFYPQQSGGFTQQSGGFAFPSMPPEEVPVTPMRQEQELAELAAAGFRCAGRGQNTPVFDNAGRPIAGSTEWVLEVYVRRTSGYLTMIFHCPMGYPMAAPRVQIKPQRGGELQWISPNTIDTWHPGRLLVEVAKELNDNIPD